MCMFPCQIFFHRRGCAGDELAGVPAWAWLGCCCCFPFRPSDDIQTQTHTHIHTATAACLLGSVSGTQPRSERPAQGRFFPLGLHSAVSQKSSAQPIDLSSSPSADTALALTRSQLSVAVGFSWL